MHIVSARKDTVSQTRNDDGDMTDPYDTATGNSVYINAYDQIPATTDDLPADFWTRPYFPPILLDDYYENVQPIQLSDGLTGCCFSYDRGLASSVLSSAHDGMTRVSRTASSLEPLRGTDTAAAAAILSDIDEDKNATLVFDISPEDY